MCRDWTRGERGDGDWDGDANGWTWAKLDQGIPEASKRSWNLLLVRPLVFFFFLLLMSRVFFSPPVYFFFPHPFSWAGFTVPALSPPGHVYLSPSRVPSSCFQFFFTWLCFFFHRRPTVHRRDQIKALQEENEKWAKEFQDSQVIVAELEEMNEKLLSDLSTANQMLAERDERIRGMTFLLEVRTKKPHVLTCCVEGEYDDQESDRCHHRARSSCSCCFIIFGVRSFVFRWK